MARLLFVICVGLLVATLVQAAEPQLPAAKPVGKLRSRRHIRRPDAYRRHCFAKGSCVRQLPAAGGCGSRSPSRK